jgi:acetolactate synthase-1/2/3 large subunit
MYTAGMAFLEALHECGVSLLYSNFGSDHPALIEALAEARAAGRPVPRVITCPNEMVALSAAHGSALVSGQAQAVLVHVECGTQALAGAVHNAAKGRAPVLIFAGRSPFTQEGELRGSRNEFIQWIQDVFDQHGIVRGYVKYDNELRTGRNVKQIVARALQFAHSDPKGPVYLTAAREVLEEETEPATLDPAEWRPIAPAALPEDGVAAIAADLIGARRPLLVTSYLGRNPEAVAELVELARRIGLAVLESVPSCLNFPTDDPLYMGNQWNQPRQNPVLAEADVILVVDSDVPWIPTVSRPAANARIHHIDVDPLKQQMPLWHIPAHTVWRADAATALRQLGRYLAATRLDESAIAERRAHYGRLHEAREKELRALEAVPSGEITPEFATACIRTHLAANSVVVSEAISNYHTVINHLALTRPGTLLASGGGSLGWSGGAALGMKLARPEVEIVAMVGDGSYMFSVPSSVFWIARHYGAPFLTVVFNNRGWKSPKLSALAVHPSGYASRANDLDVSFDPPPDYAGIAAAAGGAYARTVRRPEEMAEAVANAFRVLREEHRCAVLDVWVPRL